MHIPNYNSGIYFRDRIKRFQKLSMVSKVDGEDIGQRRAAIVCALTNSL